jgi:hypothetical protein
LGQNEDLEEKKLLGSGGYVLAKLTEQEELRASLGVPQIFIANIDRLSEDRFSRYTAINVTENILAVQYRIRKSKRRVR